MQWFGPTWNAPINESCPQAPTPIGRLCLGCREPIVEGDQGFIMPGISQGLVATGVPGPGTVAYHRECEMLGIVGHEWGICSCTNYLGLTRREAGRELVRRIEASGA